MTTNKYVTLRGTIARAKRNDCQKVVMRVTLVEELLLQLSNAEKQIAELATENAWLKQFPDQIVGFIGKLGSSEIGSETKEKIEAAAKKIKNPATDAFLAEVRAQGVEMFAAWNDKHIKPGVEHKESLTAVSHAARGFAGLLRKGVQS